MKGSTNIDDARRTSKVGRKVRAATARRDRTARSEEARTPPESTLGTLLSTVGAIGGLTGELASSALRLASRTRSGAARGVSRTPEQLRMMASAGESLRDIREVAGMTVREIVTALNLRDKSVWEAIEDGREVISFELILRLASLVARNDPLPFVLKYTRSYHPRLWGVLHELKLDEFSLQMGRERSFVMRLRHSVAHSASTLMAARTSSPRLVSCVEPAVMVAGIEVVSRQTRLGEDTAIGLLFVGMLALGVVIVALMVFFPKGVVGTITRRRLALRKWLL